MLLFLDLDGMLHPDAAFLIKGRPTLKAEGQLFMWAPLLVDMLANHPDIKIVLSTSWARELGFTRARDFLPVALRSRCIGATWHSAMARDEGQQRYSRYTWWDQATRYQQIRRYVERARLIDWIAVDDDSEGWRDTDRARLVLANSNLGLSDPATRLCLSAALGNTTAYSGERDR